MPGKTGRLNHYPLILSLLVHLAFAGACVLLLRKPAARVSSGPWTMVQLVSPKRPSPPKPPEHDEPLPNRRIVQTELGQQVARAAKDAYLGERAQLVDRETVSRTKAIIMGHGKQAMGKRAAPKPAAVAAPAVAPVAHSTPSLSTLGLAILPSAEQLRHEAAAPLKDEPRWANFGDEAPEDYVDGRHVSEHTALNTREYKFFGYYQRIRQRLDSAWVPLLREKLHRYYFVGRHLASDMEYRTKVMVVLNGDGQIVKVQIQNESGTSELDDAAIQAFNRAGPFPNPPRGMIDPKGEIRVPWEFVVRS